MIPKPPPSFSPSSNPDRRGYAPKESELAVLGKAVKELTSFHDYDAVFGKTAPQHALMLQGMEAAYQWSLMRAQLAAWDAYCAFEEGGAWRAFRRASAPLKSAFNLMVGADEKFALKYMGLSLLLGARAVIAKKGAATRSLNKKAVAEGKPATHGKVGKVRKRRAMKKLLAEK